MKAELPDIRFHDLRHSVATLLLEIGTHPKIVQELLGHENIGMTMDIYIAFAVNIAVLCNCVVFGEALVPLWNRAERIEREKLCPNYLK